MITHIKSEYKKGLIILLSLALTYCNTKPSPTHFTLTNDVDSISYYTGIFTAGTLRNFEEKKINTEVFYNAVMEVLKEKEPSISKADADYNIGRLFSKLQNRIDEKTLEEGRTFLNENKKNKHIITTTSGLQYQQIKPGNGIKPMISDKVVIKYKASLIDGTEFINSMKPNKPDTLPLDSMHMIAGVLEGIKLMDKGSVYKLYLPTELAYGKTPIPIPEIKPNMALIYEVELVEILK